MHCYLTEHVRPSHNIRAINKTSDKFRQLLQRDLEKVLEALAKCQQEEAKCKDARMKMSATNTLNNKIISNKKDELIQRVERDANILIQQLNHFNEQAIKENETNHEEINMQLSMLDGFTRYCQEVVDKATPSEVARLADDLHARARDLQDLSLVNAIPSSQVQFSPSDIVDALADDELNIVGRFQEPLDYHSGLHIDNKYFIRISASINKAYIFHEISDRYPKSLKVGQSYCCFAKLVCILRSIFFKLRSGFLRYTCIYLDISKGLID